MSDKKEKRIIIAGSVRTPMGAHGGGLRNVPPRKLLATVFKETIKRTGIDPKLIDEAYAGQIGQSSDAPNIAAVAAKDAGVPVDKPGFTVQRNCATGIQAISSAVQAIKSDDGEIFLCGGTESMSKMPHVLKDFRWGKKLQHGQVTDGIWEGLSDPIAEHLMGTLVDRLIVKKYNLTREEQDKFAVWSHQKALKAQREGKFKTQITPVTVEKFNQLGEKVGEVIVSEDEAINPMLSEQTVKMYPAIFDEKTLLKPVFKTLKWVFKFTEKKEKIESIIKELEELAEKGTVTPGNACPITDGAASVLVMTEEKAKQLGITPEAYVISYAYASTDPAYFAEGPILAVPKALKKASLKMQDIDFVELNEAFAAQAIPCQRELKIPDEKLNVWGGAIALGHPVGATGTILTVKMVYILKEHDGRFGLITMCVGGGQGGALIIENYK